MAGVLVSVLSISLLIPVCVQAQTLDQAAHVKLVWTDHQRSADWFSTGAVAGAVVLSCAETITKKCAKRAAVHIGSTVAVAEIVKRLVHRERPDRSDRKSFFSEHTAVTCAAGFTSKRAVIAAALCGGVAYLRIAAEKHWLSDVLVGAGVGVVMAQAMRQKE